MRDSSGVVHPAFSYGEIPFENEVARVRSADVSRATCGECDFYCYPPDKSILGVFDRVLSFSARSADMEDVERFMRYVRQKRLADQRELDSLDAEPSEHGKLMKELRDLRSKLAPDYF